MSTYLSTRRFVFALKNKSLTLAMHKSAVLGSTVAYNSFNEFTIWLLVSLIGIFIANSYPGSRVITDE